MKKKRPTKPVSAKERTKLDKIKKRRIEASKRERDNLTKTSPLAPELAARLDLQELRKFAPKVKGTGSDAVRAYGVDANARHGVTPIKTGHRS